MMWWGFYTISFARLALVWKEKKTASKSSSKYRSDFSIQHRDKVDIIYSVWIKSQTENKEKWVEERENDTFVWACTLGGGGDCKKRYSEEMRVGEMNKIKEIVSRWNERSGGMEEDEQKGA